MTASRELPAISCPSSLIAACAPLLGFVPSDCLVALIHGVPGRHGPVVMRVDLQPPDQAGEWAASVTASVAGTRAAAVDLVAWSACPDTSGRADLSTSPLMAALAAELDAAGIEVGQSLTTNGRVWWSHRCGQTWCCPEQATSVDTSMMALVRAEYAYAGFAPQASRDEVAARIAPDPVRAEQTGDALAAMDPVGGEPARDAIIEWISRQLAAVECRQGPQVTGLSPGMAAQLLAGLADVRVRDTVIRRLAVRGSCCTACASARIGILCEALRCAPARRGAPAATVLGLVAWMQGEGALATMALARARDDDPSYRLEHLATRLIASGTDPNDWRAGVAELTEEECRQRGRERPGQSSGAIRW